MKKLLSLLSVVTITGTSVPTVIAASPYQNEITDILNNDLETNNEVSLNKTSKIYFYNDNHSTESWTYKLTPYGAGTNASVDKSFILTINMGQENPSDYKNILSIGNSRTYRSWGSAVNEGISLGNLSSNNVFGENLKNKKVDHNYMHNVDMSYQLMKFDDWAFLAEYKGQTRIGWTWYYENGNYYLQFLINIYGNVINSYTSAYTSLELGTGFILSN